MKMSDIGNFDKEWSQHFTPKDKELKVELNAKQRPSVEVKDKREDVVWDDEWNNKLVEMIEYGFSEKDSKEALTNTNGNLRKAVRSLVNHGSRM